MIGIHYSTRIRWQQHWARAIQNGFNARGVQYKLLPNVHNKETDVSIIMGPNLYEEIEAADENYIMFNRKFLGFKDSDVHEICTVSWGGFNGCGRFCVRDINPFRLFRFISDDDISPWSADGDSYLLCHQYDTGRSSKYSSIGAYYKDIRRLHPGIRERKKITMETNGVGSKSFLNGLKKDLQDTRGAYTLNSTVGVEILLHGVPVISDDPTNPCYSVASRSHTEIIHFDRMPFLHYLAHCQWHISEIESGVWWDSLETPLPQRLHQYECS